MVGKKRTRMKEKRDHNEIHSFRRKCIFIQTREAAELTS